MALRASMGLYRVSLVCRHQTIVPHSVTLQAQLFFLRHQEFRPARCMRKMTQLASLFQCLMFIGQGEGFPVMAAKAQFLSAFFGQTLRYPKREDHGRSCIFPFEPPCARSLETFVPLSSDGSENKAPLFPPPKDAGSRHIHEAHGTCCNHYP